MSGIAASALSGTPVVARPLRGASSTFSRRDAHALHTPGGGFSTCAPNVPSRSRRVTGPAPRGGCARRAIQDNEPSTRGASAQEHYERSSEDVESSVVVPRQIVNGIELPHFEDVSTAHFRIRSGVVRTRCTKSKSLSAITGMNIFIKHEWEQATGSFKERGARNALLALSPEQRQRGVVAASAGNHALALAYHGAELGIPVTVLMPSIAPLTKITKCRALGARVILEGDSIADAAIAAQTYVENEVRLPDDTSWCTSLHQVRLKPAPGFKTCTCVE